MTLTLAERVDQSEKLIQWLDKRIEKLSIPAKHRARVAASCLDVSLEHHKSIVLLTRESYYGSAFALIRLQFEAYIRGVWLLYCASDSELEKFTNDKLAKTFGNLISDLEDHDAFNVGVLSNIKVEAWNAMNSFTHTGLLQVIRRSTATEIAPNYPEEEIVGTLDSADSTAFLATLPIVEMSIGNMSDKEELCNQLLERLTEFSSTN